MEECKLGFCQNCITGKKNLFSGKNLFCVTHVDQNVHVWEFEQETYDNNWMKRSVKFAASVTLRACMTADDP